MSAPRASSSAAATAAAAAAAAAGGSSSEDEGGDLGVASSAASSSERAAAEKRRREEPVDRRSADDAAGAGSGGSDGDGGAGARKRGRVAEGKEEDKEQEVPEPGVDVTSEVHPTGASFHGLVAATGPDAHPGEAALVRGWTVFRLSAEDWDLTAPVFLDAAKEGNLAARAFVTQHGVGDDGKMGGKPYDDELALRLYREAAVLPGVRCATRMLAQQWLGWAHDDGDLGLSEDNAQAVAMFRSAADDGFAEAQLMLAKCFASGQGVAKDMGEAVRLRRLAAGQGHSIATNDLAWCYSTGTGVATDDVEALRLFREAAELGDADTHFDVGLFYRVGSGGLTRDIDEALKWYAMADALGHSSANEFIAHLAPYGTAAGWQAALEAAAEARGNRSDKVQAVLREHHVASVAKSPAASVVVAMAMMGKERDALQAQRDALQAERDALLLRQRELEAALADK